LLKVLAHLVTDTCRSLSVSAVRTTSSAHTRVGTGLSYQLPVFIFCVLLLQCLSMESINTVNSSGLWLSPCLIPLFI
jgi:hypothetical protein